jgi:transcriptional antiterminator NusG
MHDPSDSIAPDSIAPGDDAAFVAAPDHAAGQTSGQTLGQTSGESSLTAERSSPAPATASGLADESAEDDPTAATEPTIEPAKKLGRGVTKRKGEAPKTLTGAGVATSKALMPTTKKGKAGAKAAQEEPAEQAFDPATDLPMYREGMNWFVLRVASNKESSVRETLLRKVQIEGMEDLVGRIMVPTEKTKTLKAGKHRITETKLYPGYVFVEMKLEPDGRIPQDVFFLIKETSGVGDFVGTAGRPTPMAPHEVEKMLFDSKRPEEAPTVRMDFKKGDAVTIKEGHFQNFTGTVDEVLPDRGLVRLLVTIFGRQAPIELEYWQIAKAEQA